jgi:hypothetical protein
MQSTCSILTGTLVREIDPPKWKGSLTYAENPPETQSTQLKYFKEVNNLRWFICAPTQCLNESQSFKFIGTSSCVKIKFTNLPLQQRFDAKYKLSTRHQKMGKKTTKK